MRIMKLHLYQDIIYLCGAGNYSPTDPLGNLSSLQEECRNAGISLNDEEILLQVSRSGTNPVLNTPCFGAGPVLSMEAPIPEIFSFFTLSAGDYLFYQFPDPTADEITTAYRNALSGLYARGWKPKGDNLYLRGVKEESQAYALQVFIPLTD